MISRGSLAPWRFFLFTSLYHWRQVILDLEAHAVRKRYICTRVHTRASHCSLQLRVTSRVQTMSFRFARLRILLSVSLSFLLLKAHSPTLVAVSAVLSSAYSRRTHTYNSHAHAILLRFSRRSSNVKSLAIPYKKVIYLNTSFSSFCNITSFLFFFFL